jgi:hypothetical protein
MLENFIAIWSISLPFCIFYGQLVYIVVILVDFSRFNMLTQEKSGNSELQSVANVILEKTSI